MTIHKKNIKLSKLKRYQRDILIAIILLIFIPIILLIFSPKHKNSSKPPSGKTINQTINANLLTIKAVGKLMDLPVDEKPTIATVTDPSVLPHQDFFKKAQKDDKVIIYKNNKLAILYRPGINKIITSAEVDFQNNQPAITPSPQASPSAEISLVPTVDTSRPAHKILITK